MSERPRRRAAGGDKERFMTETPDDTENGIELAERQMQLYDGYITRNFVIQARSSLSKEEFKPYFRAIRRLLKTVGGAAGKANGKILKDFLKDAEGDDKMD